VSSSAAIGSDGTVYISAWDGNLYAFGGSEEKETVEESQVKEDYTKEEAYEETEKNIFKKIIDWIIGLFTSKKTHSEISYKQETTTDEEKVFCSIDEKYENSVPEDFILSIPFDLEDYYPNYWGMIPYCADP